MLSSETASFVSSLNFATRSKVLQAIRLFSGCSGICLSLQSVFEILVILFQCLQSGETSYIFQSIGKCTVFSVNLWLGICIAACDLSPLIYWYIVTEIAPPFSRKWARIVTQISCCFTCLRENHHSARLANTVAAMLMISGVANAFVVTVLKAPSLDVQLRTLTTLHEDEVAKAECSLQMNLLQEATNVLQDDRHSGVDNVKI